MTKSAIIKVMSLGFPWQTLDPFLFCVFHEDFYPKGNKNMEPQASLEGRNIGQDFTIKDGWRMYHGDKIPGFPGHPHRGFETITVVNKGLVDHADSLGAAGRYGRGDVQWMTAGKGVQHSEMFPLINQESDNHLELFQIWLNLPKKNKMVEPHFKMLWSDTIPIYTSDDHQVEIQVLCGAYQNLVPPNPPPNSWAANPENDVAIWSIKMAPGARWSLPATHAGLNRMLYFFKGNVIRVEKMHVSPNQGIQVHPSQTIHLVNGDKEARLLLLQGRPIGEPVAQYGPFVMNNQAEIHQAFVDYQETQFGGWPWARQDVVHPIDKGRFAKHTDGGIEEKSE